MTTIVWDGKILAADSRTTVENASHHTSAGIVCGHCGNKAHRVKDNSLKIHNGFNQSFRNEPIIAIGGSGNRSMIDKAIKLLRDGENLEIAHRLLHKIAADRYLSDFRLLIVTTGHVYTVDGTVPVLDITEHPLSEKVSIGSGKMAALLLFKMDPKATAIDAVRAAISVDKYTGGEVNWIDCSTKATNIKIETGDLVVKTKTATKRSAPKKAEQVSTKSTRSDAVQRKNSVQKNKNPGSYIR